MKKIAIIGYGYWGKNLARNFNSVNDCELMYICEKKPEFVAQCKKLYPNVNVVSDHTIPLKDPSVDGIVIATPVDTHYPLAKEALNANKHVLVEKPLTDSYKDAKELQELANKKELVLMVDHTFLYTGAVRYMKKIINEDVIGEIEYLDSTRINLGLFQHDVNVLWDLAPHDISICSFLLNKKPKSVQATGVSHTNNDIENIAYLTLKYDNNVIAHFNCSWVSPVKIRQMLIGGSKKMVLYNDMEATEKIKIYDTGYKARTDEEVDQIKVDYRTGDIHVPKVPMTEALSLMAQDFISSISDKSKTPVSHSQLGVDVVEILEKAGESIKNNGKEIVLK